MGVRAALAESTRPSGAAEAGAVPLALNFLDAKKARQAREALGSPAFVYDLKTLRERASDTLAFPNAYGLTVRFAMKAAPNRAVLTAFREMGLHIDASSGYEVLRAIAAGFEPSQISLSSQEIPIGRYEGEPHFKDLVAMGAKVNACSLHQLELFGQHCPGGEVGLRFNPGLGSGGTSKTNVGGPSSSFGIWHGLVPEAQAIVEKYGLKVVRIHTHIGSGSDPAVWQKVSNMSLDLCAIFPDVQTLNLGGGYKVARVPSEKSTVLSEVGVPVVDNFRAFASKHNRELHLEIEPGTFLVANACSLVSTVQDKVATTATGPNGADGTDGYTFLKLDAGMTEVLRPSLYGSQHPIAIVPAAADKDANARADGESAPADASRYVVVGHCCESGDLVTPSPDDPEALLPRVLNHEDVEIGDIAVVEGVGAYCSSMSTKNYNSFPEAAEGILDLDGNVHLIRKRQAPEAIWANEVDPPASAKLQ